MLISPSDLIVFIMAEQQEVQMPISIRATSQENLSSEFYDQVRLKPACQLQRPAFGLSKYMYCTI